MPSVFLVGFMASGKSTVAARLAAELSLPLLDLDAAVEKLAGRSISEIFERDGEGAFREYERRSLEWACGKGPAVVDLGGGAFCVDSNRQLIAASGGVSVYLSVPWPELRRRLATDHTERPLFIDLEQTEQLLAQREPLYRLADVIVDLTGSEEPAEVAALVAAKVLREAPCAT